MGRKLYNRSTEVVPQTDYSSVLNENGDTLKSEIDGIGSIIHETTIESFTVDVCYETPISNTQTTDSQTQHKEYTTYAHSCYFSAYGSGEKAKLVISMPGGGMSAANWYNYMDTGKILNTLGYAVLCITGYSQAYMTSKGVSSNAAPVGSWYATEEVVKAYKYITDKYKWIDTNGVYIFAESQGGMIAENVVDFGGIPIKAVALDAPALSMQHVQMNLRMPSVAAVYGIQSGNFDASKCIGCDPWTRGVSEPISNTLANVTAKKTRNTNSPLLIIGGTSDSFVQPWTLQCYTKALMNAGQWVELHRYSGLTSPAHGVVQYSQVVGKIGITDITSGMVDIIAFFKRFGGYGFEVIPVDNDESN